MIQTYKPSIKDLLIYPLYKVKKSALISFKKMGYPLPFKLGENYILLGFTDEERQHTILVGKDGKIYSGYDLCDFTQVNNSISFYG